MQNQWNAALNSAQANQQQQQQSAASTGQPAPAIPHHSFDQLLCRNDSQVAEVTKTLESAASKAKKLKTGNDKSSQNQVRKNPSYTKARPTGKAVATNNNQEEVDSALASLGAIKKQIQIARQDEGHEDEDVDDM